MKKLLKPGTTLIHRPSVRDVTDHLKLEFVIDEWLELVPKR